MATYNVRIFTAPPPPVEHSETIILALRGIQFLSSAVISVLAIATIMQWDEDADRPKTAIEMPELACYSIFVGVFGVLVSLEGSITLVWDTMHYVPFINLDALCTTLFFAGGCALAHLWRINDANPSNDWCHQLDDSERVVYDRCDHFENQIMASAIFQMTAFTISLLLTFLAIMRRRRKSGCEPAEQQWLLEDQKAHSTRRKTYS